MKIVTTKHGTFRLLSLALLAWCSQLQAAEDPTYDVLIKRAYSLANMVILNNLPSLSEAQLCIDNATKARAIAESNWGKTENRWLVANILVGLCVSSGTMLQYISGNDPREKLEEGY